MEGGGCIYSSTIAAPPLFFSCSFFLEVVVWRGVELTAAVIPQKREGEF